MEQITQTPAAVVTTPAVAAPAKKTVARKTRTAPAKKMVTKGAGKPETPATVNFLPAASIAMSGSFLASFTRAWMEITGFIQGKPVTTSLIRTLLGSGVRYHENKGNIEKSEKGYVITPQGKDFFLTRTTIVPNPEFVEAYKILMTKGTPDAKIRVADAGKIRKVA
jgi:hypothetical protein